MRRERCTRREKIRYKDYLAYQMNEEERAEREKAKESVKSGAGS